MLGKLKSAANNMYPALTQQEQAAAGRAGSNADPGGLGRELAGFDPTAA